MGNDSLSLWSTYDSWDRNNKQRGTIKRDGGFIEWLFHNRTNTIELETTPGIPTSCVCLFAHKSSSCHLHCNRDGQVIADDYWLVGSLFNDVFSVTRLYRVDDSVIIEWRWIVKDLVGSSHDLILRYYPGIRLEWLRKATKKLNQDGRSPGPRIEPGFSRIRTFGAND
jgi:hypothetical protein